MSFVPPKRGRRGPMRPPVVAMQGEGWLGDAVKWLRKNKVVSRAGSALGSMGVPYAGAIGSAAGALGFGKKRRGRRMRGGAAPPGNRL